MNKKGILAVVVIIIIVVVAIIAMGKSGDSVSNTPDNNPTTNEPTGNVPAGVTKETYAPVTKDSTDATVLTRLKSASVAASESGARVALVNGSAKFSEGNVKGTLTLGDVAVEKTIGENKYVLASLAVNSGGSGTYQYVVLFEDASGTLTDKSYALVGDRVKVTGIRVDSVTDSKGQASAVVSVSYLDRDSGEPMSATPSVPRTKIFVAEAGVFNPAREITL